MGSALRRLYLLILFEEIDASPDLALAPAQANVVTPRFQSYVGTILNRIIFVNEYGNGQHRR